MLQALPSRLPSPRDPVWRHRLFQLLVDAGLVALAYFLAYLLRFDEGIPRRYGELLGATIVFVVVGKIAIFYAFGLYDKWWRYAGLRDFESILKACVVASLVLVGVLFVWSPTDNELPRSVAAMDLLLTIALITGARFIVRAVIERPPRGAVIPKGQEVLIIGAGEAGQLIVREMRRSPELRQTPIGFVDDDPRKRGMRIFGLKVLGTTRDLERLLDEVEPDEVIIAIPSAPGIVRERVVRSCRERDILVRTLPGVFELISGSVNLMRQVREVQVEDILGRQPIKVEIGETGSYLSERTVLVTGAGGSIGAELCRQIAHVKPRLLVMVDHAEDNLFEIERELLSDRHFTGCESILADCKDTERMVEVMQRFHPDVIFHAAAYKHVALTEDNPLEAVRNNTIGTQVVATAAADAGADLFVLVSTDKAVRPITALGGSKAIAEWIVDACEYRYPDTSFCSVRFGNVLGSSGSVVPLFRRQIEKGGPVTVTHPDMARYFMTIPEAVQLIIRSGKLSTGGEVFVLEMGEQVRIIDLARNMIRLSGQEVDRDIRIEIVGPRPGEKLREELFNEDEQPVATEADRIVKVERESLDPDRVDAVIDQVGRLVEHGDEAFLAQRIAELARLPRQQAVKDLNALIER
ncbi:MAG: nucleoside-diphosphate sugar epimerase/dehydratase [Solirubrobacterales bacterium]